MKLAHLVARLIEVGLPLQEDALSAADAGKEAVAVSADSRQVSPGCVFVAVSGATTDGHRYIPDAIQRGAVAVFGTQPLSGLPLPYFRVDDSRRALAYLAAALLDFPARKLTVIGVTGTDGKTTTSSLIFEILKAAGLRAGMVSTVSAVIGDQELDTGFHVTTPDAPAMQSYLKRMVDAGMTHVVLEATSHGLAQARTAACDFDLAVVTNITHEHLDYHGSYEAYRAAKGLLFAGLADTPPKAHRPPRGAALNGDDDSFEYLQSITKVFALKYGLRDGEVHAELSADDGAFSSASPTHGVTLLVVGKDLQGDPFRFAVKSRLIGDFNRYNLLAAVAVTRGLMRLPDTAIQQGIAEMKGVPGRMEAIEMGQDFLALVDFAHTPNALRRALQAARQMTSGRVIAVFGSAGLRDREKRRLMAETSAELADLTVLTAEDPRTESLSEILAEMAKGAESRGGREGSTYWRVPDRGEALRMAVRLARPGDLVIACGKGHEQSMCFGETEYPWDDRLALRAALAELLGVEGPPMPYLPTQD